jgi:hypothetical protein
MCPEIHRTATHRRIHSVRQAFARMCILGLLPAFCVAGQAQEFHIKALNAKNGKPITDECLNVWYGTLHAFLVAKTDKYGVAVLHFAQAGLSTEAGCAEYPTQISRPADGSGITVGGQRHIVCQKYGKIKPGAPPANPLTTMPSYPVNTILNSGISASNTCGKFRAQAAPGELILFMRAPHWWELMKQ